jgi:hypothetical protein
MTLTLISAERRSGGCQQFDNLIDGFVGAVVGGFYLFRGRCDPAQRSILIYRYSRDGTRRSAELVPPSLGTARAVTDAAPSL